MTVLLLGVGADGQNVRPPPRIGPERRFEYIPIPEKSRATAESRSYGSMSQRYGEGTLAGLLTAIRPRGGDGWINDADTIQEHPVHYDPNLEALTYGEGGKDQNVAAIDDHLTEDDLLAFYSGFDTDGNMHRYVFGYFTVAADPIIIDEDTPSDTVADILAAHPENAHAKRVKGNDDLYAFDPDRPQGASRVALVDGTDPGGLLDRAVRLSDPDTSGHFYMRDDVAKRLQPSTTYLGGFKPPIRCDISSGQFLEFLTERQP